MRCRDVAFRISSEELERASWPTRLLTRLHLLYCRRCRRHAEQLDALGTIGRETLGAGSADADGLDALQERIMAEAFGGDGDDESSVQGDPGGPGRSRPR